MKSKTVKISLDINRSHPHTHGDKPCCRGGIVINTSKPGVPENAGPSKKAQQQPSARRHGAECDKGCCRRHLVDVLGAGHQKFPFPTVDRVVRSINTALTSGRVTVERSSGQDGSNSSVTLKIQAPQDGKGKKKPNRPSSSSTTPKLPAGGALKRGNANALRVAAEMIRQIFHDGRFDADVANKFNPLRGACSWGLKNMDDKYKPALNSLDEHLEKIQQIYRDSIPKVMNMVAAQYPDLSEDELRVAALQLLDQQQELAQILYVLSRWTEAVAQFRDGMYDSLQAVVTVVEEAFYLFVTGNIEGARLKAHHALLKTMNLSIGSVFLAYAGDGGPATIPGAKGPVGANLILVPQDELSIIMLMMVLYLHEFRHDIFADVEGLEEEEAKVVLKAIKDAHAAGRIKLSSEVTKIGSSKVATIDLLCKLFLDNLGEIDADLVGGIEMSGWSFALNMIYVFSAFNSRKEGAIRNKELLRTGSHYEISENGELSFEPHPPDYFRVQLNAAALELIGFPEQAAEIRALADVAVGTQKPTVITWEDAAGKRKPIEIALSDLQQLCSVVVEAILMTPMQSLAGKCNHQIVWWSEHLEDKKQALKNNMLSGVTDIPEELGDVSCTLVAAAAAEAFYDAIKDGLVDAADAPHAVSNLALQMLYKAVARQAQRRAAADKAYSKPAAPAAPVDGGKQGGK